MGLFLAKGSLYFTRCTQVIKRYSIGLVTRLTTNEMPCCAYVTGWIAICSCDRHYRWRHKTIAAGYHEAWRVSFISGDQGRSHRNRCSGSVGAEDVKDGNCAWLSRQLQDVTL
jgi:hypothetical protein